MTGDSTSDPSAASTWLRAILRVIGTSSLFALVFLVAPRSWMEAIHEQLGMGSLPNAPIVGYLARSTSAWYAIAGGLFWVISFDLERHRLVLTYMGVALVGFGVALFIVDWTHGLPRLWVLWEGPFVALLGGAIASLSRRLP